MNAPPRWRRCRSGPLPTNEFAALPKEATAPPEKHILKNEKAFKIEYTRNGNPKPESYDRADAIVVAKAGWKLQTIN